MKHLLLILFLLPVAFIQAQWEPDVRLTNDPGEAKFGWDNTQRIAANGDTIYVIFRGDKDFNGMYGLYFKRSIDAGVNWDADVQLVSSDSYSTDACGISVFGFTVHVVWTDHRDGNYKIYYKRSTDAGVTWSADMQLSGNDAIPNTLCIDVFGSIVHIVWRDQRDGTGQIYYKRSTDAGLTWEADVRLTENSASAFYDPYIAVSYSDVHVVWTDERDGNYEVYYKHSTDGGLNWGTDTRLTNDIAFSGYTHISVSGSFVNVVWSDGRDGNWQIYYKRSSDAGQNWEVDTRLTNISNTSGVASVSASGSSVHVVWIDIPGVVNPQQIFYKRSTDGGVNWEDDTQLTTNIANTKYSPAVLGSKDVVHVVWVDTRDAGYAEIYYKRNPTGNSTNTEVPLYQYPLQFKLEQNFPNPFTITTKIGYQLQMEGYVRIKVYDLFGKEVATLVNEEKTAGTYDVDFDATNIKSGIYILKLQAGLFTKAKKMVVMK